MAGDSDASDAPVAPDRGSGCPVMKGFFQSGSPKPEDLYRSVAEIEQRERLIQIMNGAVGLIFPLLIAVQVLFFLVMALLFGGSV